MSSHHKNDHALTLEPSANKEPSASKEPFPTKESASSPSTTSDVTGKTNGSDTSGNSTSGNSTSGNSEDKQQKMLLQLQRVVCICKGISLNKVLPALKLHGEVSDVHECAGTGTGGCQGRRCTPRIKTLLKKSENLRR